MSITPEAIESIRAWAAQGIDLNGIQKNLTDQGFSIRFMDLRFLLLDHGIEIAEIAAPTPPVEQETTTQPEAPATPAAAAPSTTAALVKVSLDELQIPGTMLSGKALFTSGIRGAWSFDSTGAFSWNDLSDRPTETELQAFQHELNLILSQGMS